MRKIFNQKWLALSEVSPKADESKGFTLIELLIVIAVLGVLATVVLVAINPVEQLARGRDAGRKTTAGQLSKAVQAYYTSQTAVYPTANATWITTLVNAGEIKSAPAAISYSVSGITACATDIAVTPAIYAQNGFCYSVSTTSEATVFTRLESKSETSKCASGTPNAYFMWDSSRGSTCLVCKATTAQPAIGDTCNTTQ